MLKERKNNSCLQIFLSSLGKYLPCQVYCSVSHSLQTQRLKCQLFPGLHTRRLQNPLFHMCSSADRSTVRRQNLIYIPQADEMRDLWSCFFCVCVNARIYIFSRREKKKLSAGSAFDSLQVQRVIYKREYFCKDSHASLSVPVLEILRLFAQMSVLVSDLGRIVISAMTKVTGRSLGVLLLRL